MDQEQYKSLIIEDLGLSVRTYNSLKRAGINTFAELYEAYKADTLLKISNFGKYSCQEVSSVISRITSGEMTFEDDKPFEVPAEIENIPIIKLNLTTRSYNGLVGSGYDTVGKVVRMTKVDVVSIRGLGSKCIAEILSVISEIKYKGVGFFEERINECDRPYDWGVYEEELSEEIKSKPINELNIHGRVYSGLVHCGFDTIGKLFRITNGEIGSVPGLGEKGIEELRSELRELKEKGIDYFAVLDKKDMPLDEENKRAIDVDTVNKLKAEYGFKPTWINEWYGITRSRAQQILTSDKKRGNWLNRTINEKELVLLDRMIKQRLFYLSDDGIRAYFVNNRKDDCAVIFVTDEEIKCFFLNMLPEDIQVRIKDAKLELLTSEELEIISSGRIEIILKKEYFFTEDSTKFRKYAHDRNMSTEEYCKFLTGMEYGTKLHTVNDKKIIDFLNSHYVDGELVVPLNNSTMWFRSYVTRHGFTIESMAEFFGFVNKKEDKEWVLGTIAEDMVPHDVEADDWIDKLYAKYPLLGNCILTEEQEEEISSIAKECVDRKLNDYRTKLTLKEEMTITLAVINYAKNWNTEDSAFWNYITAQFGYRDESNQLRGILCDVVLDATRKNQRVFIANQYKATIAIHALTTKKSWMLFFDFLFDFYKTNMDWTYIEDDPLIARMVIALRDKLITESASTEEDTIRISTKVYSFTEGISKLKMNRTGYSIKLIEHMLRRIDDIINHRELPAEQYVDALCDMWMLDKLSNARAENKRERNVAARDIATDYTRIHPKYIMQNETNVVIALPDIRLKKTDFGSAELKVFVGDAIVETRSLSFYGNELGKTLNGFDINVGACSRHGDGSLNISIILSCDGENIYDSEDSLHRDALCFSKNKECSIHDCSRGAYSFFTTANAPLEFEGAEISDIDAGNRWKAYFARLGPGFIVKCKDMVVSFDSESASSSAGIRVILPSSESGMTYVKNGRRYGLITKDSYFLLILKSLDELKKYSIIMNSTQLNLDDVDTDTTENGTIIKIPVKPAYDKTCDFRVIDLAKGKIISNCTLKLIYDLSFKFNRPFYFLEEDFEEANVRVWDSHGMKQYDLNSRDEFISIPYNDGTVDIKIPKIVVRGGNGDLWPRGYSSWIKDIKQDEKIYVSIPQGCSCCLRVGSKDVTEETSGCFDYGNAVFAFSGSPAIEWLNVNLLISNEKTNRKYNIGRISPNEKFLGQVQFNYRDSILFWNRGQGFVGNSNGKFKLILSSETNKYEFPLSLEEDIVINNCDLPHEEYNYKINKESENIFSGSETTIHEGSLIIGDKDEIRFVNSAIHIINITNEDGDILRRIPIKNTYIDQISFEGIEFVDSEDRECPVYKGVMFYMGDEGQHYNFSFARKVSSKGFQKYKINPVRIVYINDHTLSITDEDCDGIYYYRYFDRKVTFSNVYLITDREPDKNNRDTYSVADLYTYRKERIT